jgi:hypothetical protein
MVHLGRLSTGSLKETQMSSYLKLFAALTLLGTLAGCAQLGMGGPTTPAEWMQDPPIYESTPSG